MTIPAGFRQLPLEVALNERLDFSLFVGADNAAIRQYLQAFARQPHGQVYLWGASGVGKSHLLQATCQEAGQLGCRVAYLPLAQFAEHGPGLLEGLDTFDLVALDDLQTIAGQEDWEQGLFGFYNAVRDAGNGLAVAADSSPRGLSVDLPDLVSRLGWGEVFHLQPLSDDEKREALVRRAAARGIELPDDVAGYLLRRTVRDMTGLMTWLDHLDQAQLAAKRRLSIPFVKSLLEEPNGQV